MSWLADLAAAAGIPAGGASAAIALYYGSVAAEKEARPEALADIAHALKDPSWSAHVRPIATIERLFRFTFGERQLSWKCVRRSVLATLAASISLGLIFSSVLIGLISLPDFQNNFGIDLGLFLTVVIGGFIPDYFSIWKTRLLLQFLASGAGILKGLGLACLDIVLSIAISYCFATFGSMLLLEAIFAAIAQLGCHVDFGLDQTVCDPTMSFAQHLSLSTSAFGITEWPRVIWEKVWAAGHDRDMSIYSICFLSTMLTSVWTIANLASSLLVKLLHPVEYARRFITWFFPVDSHPIRAVGAVAGMLVLITSLAVSTMRAILG